jgi:hypothetical protein
MLKNSFNSLPPAFLPVCGLAAALPFLLIQPVSVKVILCLLYISGAALKGGRIKPVFITVFFVSITLFYAFTSYGEVLLSFNLWDTARIRITAEGLNSGLARASTFLGLIYLSRFSISTGGKIRSLKLPYIPEMFAFFEKLTSSGIKIRLNFLAEDLDRIFFSCFETEKAAEKAAEKKVSSKPAAAFSLLCVLLSWAAYIHSL